LSQQGLNPIKLAYSLSLLTASASNRLGQYASSPGHTVTQNSPFIP